ncbi:MAG: AAA family ATPase [Nitrospinae bacterium]|nr:AAA family ATPase [Nitrospinota bacterium]
MITKVRVRYFKKFEDEEFDLREHIILAGQNNSGKTTLLQAIAVWNLALRKWLAKRASSKAKIRTGVTITRKEFTAIPLREMSLLWTNASTALKKEELQGKKAGPPRVMTIALVGKTTADEWELAFEFRYQGEEVISVKPSVGHEGEIPKAVEDFNVVHVPPFSGIGAEETQYKREYQDLLIGQGKPGDIVRNLLVEVHAEKDKPHWDDLREQIKQLFGFTLLPPNYEGRPFILCEYLPGIPKGKGMNGLPRLDIASAGSGFHQVLMLLAFFYARPASILLLDEPDAHLHVILQEQIYDKLKKIAVDRRCQLIIATHSEVLIDATSPNRILSFYKAPHLLVDDTDRDQVREALKRLTVMDMLLAESASGILYVESESDFNLLRSWAEVLNHPMGAWFNDSPLWRENKGRNPKEARAHFFALRAVKPKIKGYLLLDGDNRNLPDRELSGDHLTIGRWIRYEAESYLIHPEALLRFAEAGLPLYANNYLHDKLPGSVFRNPLENDDYLNRTPASKTLLPGFFKEANIDLPKSEYYRIAEQMKKEEIPPEVKEKLDQIYRALGLQNER